MGYGARHCKWITDCDGSQQGQWTGRGEPAPVTAHHVGKVTMIPKNEQACAILNAREWELAHKYFDGNQSKLEAAFTVTRQDLKDYIEEHGFPNGWWHFAERTQDGLYLVEKDGMWVMYIQERERIDYEYPEKFKTKEEGVDYILDTFYLKRP